eukprot:5094683-Pleurochrysis_carterae.AAC.1
MAENVWRYVLSIRQVHASRSTPSKAYFYLAINPAHELYAAFYACHGSPHFIKFGFLELNVRNGGRTYRLAWMPWRLAPGITRLNA